MFKNYIKVAFRNLMKQKKYYAINIFGLSFGLTCVILIMLWVQHERSFDTFHSNRDNLARVISHINGLNTTNEEFKLPILPPPLAGAMKDHFPDVVNSTRVGFAPKVVIKRGDRLFYEDRGVQVDPDFFEMFSFPIVRGDIKTALSDPFNVVLTKSFAEKYFGENNPLEEELIIDGNPFKVSAVIEDVPDNSHLQFDFVQSIQLKEALGDNLNDWGNVNVSAYVQLANNVNIEEFNSKLRSWQTPRKNDYFFLQPLLEVHSHPDYSYEYAVVCHYKYVLLFSIIGGLILFIGCINFVNITTAQSLTRTKEIGIRKVVGSDKAQLKRQFFTEISVSALIALILAFLMTELFLPSFNSLVEKHLSLRLFNTEFLLGIGIFFSLAIIISGLYPAVRFASLKPLQLVKETNPAGNSKSKLRKSLVVFQFAVSIILIIGVVIINQQLSFMKNSQSNFKDDIVLTLPFKGHIGERYESMKSALLEQTSILCVSAKNSMPTENADKTNEISWAGNNEKIKLFEATAVDYDYFKTMGIDIKEGRSFSNQFTSDQNDSFILNELAVEQMELQNPIGQQIWLWGHKGTVVGVAKTANFQSLKEKASPQVFYMIPEYTIKGIGNSGVLLIRISPENIQSTIATIKNTWEQFNPQTPSEFSFFDEAVNKLYWSEIQLHRFMNYGSLLAIIISCLGLFSLASFSAERRIKEIGVRKILGASVLTIIALLFSDFTKAVLISNLFAWPIAYYGMNKWLEDFAYRIDISWWVFILSGGIALLIALATVSYQAIKAATANPIESLKYE